MASNPDIFDATERVRSYLFARSGQPGLDRETITMIADPNTALEIRGWLESSRSRHDWYPR